MWNHQKYNIVITCLKVQMTMKAVWQQFHNLTEDQIALYLLNPNILHFTWLGNHELNDLFMSHWHFHFLKLLQMSMYQFRGQCLCQCFIMIFEYKVRVPQVTHSTKHYNTLNTNMKYVACTCTILHLDSESITWCSLKNFIWSVTSFYMFEEIRSPHLRNMMFWGSKNTR